MAKIVKRNLLGKKKANKPVQYAIGGVVALVMLVLWITSPSRGSSFSTAVIAAGNPFSSRVSDVSALSSAGDDTFKSETQKMAEEMGSHDGGNNLLGSLFSSGFEEEKMEFLDGGSEAAAAPSADDGGSASDSYSSPSASPASGGSVSDGARAKLSALNSSLGGSGGGSTSTSGGGNHNKFFGSGNPKTTVNKIDIGTQPKKNAPLSAPGKQGLTSLQTANRYASDALKTNNLGSASATNSLAFDGGTKKATTDFLDTGTESASGAASLGLGQAITDLKTNDPKLNTNKVTPPSKPKDASKESDDWKKELIKSLISGVVGPVLQTAVKGAMGGGDK
jgi:hypothetical protein